MASFDYRLNPLYAIKECLSCGALYTADFCCSKGGLEDNILVPKSPQNCATCGDPVDGLYCRSCTFVRKCLNEGWYTIHDENEILNTSESSNDNTNIVSAPQEPFVFNQDPGQNSSRSPPHIDHNCCYECGDSLDDIFCQRCTNRNEAFKEHSETIIDFNDDSTSSDDGSYENIDYVDASPLDVEIVSLEVIEIVIPEVGGIDTNILLTIKDDILREKLLNVNLLIANIEALKDNPAPSSDVMTKSSSTSLNLFLEETNTFDNSSPESETFYFDLEENSSGSTTTRSDYSLPDYEAFYDDHIEEKSSGSTITLADFSQYDPFIFGLSINPFPPADRNDFYHEEFADGLAHVISPSEYDHFCFKIEPELGNLTMYVVEDIFPTREPRVHVPNVLTTHPTFHMDTDFILFSEPLFAYIVWIFLPFLTDKSSDSETYASCDSSLKTKTKDFPPAVDIKTLPESDVEDPNSTAGSPSFSCLENVKSPRIFCNKSGMNNRNVCKNNSVRVKKCFVCGSKLHLIKDCDFYNCVDSVPCKSKAASVPAGSRNSSASVTAGGSDPAASRNRPAVNSAGRPNPTGRVGQAAHLAAAQSNPAGWSKRPAPVSAGRPVSAGWLNPAARPYFRPSSVYFNNMYWPEFYDPMYMNKGRWGTAGDPSSDNDIGIVDSGCSRSMTGNKEKLDDFVQVKGGIVKFGGGDGRISGKGTIRTSKLDFENVYYVEELQHFNLFSVSQICDKKNKVLFTDTDCLVLTEEFQLPDESQVVLRIPRERDLYTFSISDLQPEQNVTCLVAKASLDESTRWHRRMAHVNFKTINKLAKEGLVDGLPLKVFTNEHNCVACNKGKQHKASYKHISAVRLITETLQLLHMDLFGPTNIRSIDQKYYSLVVTDDFSRFTWTFFLGTKDETFYVLKEFIALIENQLNKKVKGIRCDNGTEFKNAKLIELCGEKGIKRDYSNPRTPQQNGVAERKNRTLIEAARTMLADSKLPTMFWTEAVSTACYVLNRVSITNPHNKTPYELISGKVPQIGIGHDGSWYTDHDSDFRRWMSKFSGSFTFLLTSFAGSLSSNGPSVNGLATPDFA
ncbi:putative ribonuclease H-like domain-containing protein [Tanacetum coccineum]|uniref:Ribonuclease H-like domain-containing protein n=1 Tax=Tanacetum coccineum TaxID=301880 RepID=A0ABQ5DX02_9ASTR